MIATILIRTIAATLPAGVRDRYREEWTADLAGSAGLGMSPASIVVGALGTALGIDRENPAVAGIAPRRLAFRRLRVGFAFLGVALSLGVGGLAWGLWSTGVPVVTALLVVVTAFAGLVVLVSFVGAVRAWRRSRGSRPRTSADVAVAITLPLAVAATALVPWVGVPLLLSVMLGVVVVIVTEDPRPQGAPAGRRRALLLAGASATAILAALAASLLHVYVWNPLARVPGRGLDEIYAGLAAAGELPSPILPVLWAVLWGTGALALVVCAALPQPRIRRLLTTRRLVGAGILGVAFVAGGTWVIGFGMGMGMADAFMTSGGDAAVSGPVLAGIGGVAFVAALLVGLLPGRIRPGDTAAAS